MKSPFTKSQIQSFIKRLAEIVQAEKDLDYQKTCLARDIRLGFAIGDVGDRACIEWCQAHLRLQHNQAVEIITRAVAAVICPDEETYKQVGGKHSHTAIAKLAELSKSKQISTLKQARDESLTVQSVLARQDGPRRVYHSPSKDAESLAIYINSTRGAKKLPPAIEELVKRYAPPWVLKAVA